MYHNIVCLFIVLLGRRQGSSILRVNHPSSVLDAYVAGCGLIIPKKGDTRSIGNHQLINSLMIEYIH